MQTMTAHMDCIFSPVEHDGNLKPVRHRNYFLCASIALDITHFTILVKQKRDFLNHFVTTVTVEIMKQLSCITT